MSIPIEGELNPNHGVTQEVRDQWHKLCAILMFKLGHEKVQITVADIDRMMQSGKPNITIRPKGDVITLQLVSDAEALRLAREEGGLPV